MIINTSGLLDANEVGGEDRGPGLSPREIKLDSNLLPDFKDSGSLIDPESGSLSAVNDAEYAFAQNRNNAWRRFESIRDLVVMNDSIRGNLINPPIESFSTFSHSLATNDNGRTFMGTNEATLNLELIDEELENIAAVEPKFVLQQLYDYLDTDTLPQDLDGNYSDYSVEPVPMINELALTFNFTYFPTIETNVDDEGETELEVVLVTITNTYELELEVWYPFVGFTNAQIFTLSITDPPIESGSVEPDLFGTVIDWTAGMEIPATQSHPDNRETPYDLLAYSETLFTEVTSEGALLDLFETLESNIQFPTLVVANSEGNKVDQTLKLELPMVEAANNEWMPAMELIASNLFDAAVSEETTNTLSISMSCIDPRLNWDGADLNQWQEQYSAEGAFDTIGDINFTELGLVVTPDPQDMMYVRNQDRIDSSWEFTYLLYNSLKPWQTFQMLEANDPDNTRAILENLSPHPRGPPKSGRVSPFSPYTNVLASVFMEMPIDEFMGANALTRLDQNQALQAAQFFMKQSEWVENSAECTADIDLDDLENIMGGESNPWILESYFRNSRELFDPDDTLYTILTAAQSGTDLDENGIISNDEVRSTEQAIVYVWRERTTGKAAIVFYGLTDTLQSTIGGGESWRSILKAFEP